MEFEIYKRDLGNNRKTNILMIKLYYINHAACYVTSKTCKKKIKTFAYIFLKNHSKCYEIYNRILNNDISTMISLLMI